MEALQTPHGFNISNGGKLDGTDLKIFHLQHKGTETLRGHGYLRSRGYLCRGGFGATSQMYIAEPGAPSWPFLSNPP